MQSNWNQLLIIIYQISNLIFIIKSTSSCGHLNILDHVHALFHAPLIGILLD